MNTVKTVTNFLNFRKKMKKIIINADDLGFSVGVNQAILKANTEGYLTHASLMANTEYFQDAIQLIPKFKNLRIGVHVTLTCGKALYDKNVLAKNGKLDWTFAKLLFLRKTSKVLESLENEIENQILKIKENGIEISHIDGHEHVHIIPSINKIVRRLAKKHQIPRIREINENFFESLKFNGSTTNLANIIKLILLKTLSLFNKGEKKIGFYCMMNTCDVRSKNLFRFLRESKSYETVEIMLHPGINSLDSEEYLRNLDSRFVSFFKDDSRRTEFELCFEKEFEAFVRI